MTRMVQVAVAGDVTEAEELEAMLRSAGIDTHLEPAIDEQRSFYRFLLEHPIGRPPGGLPAEDSRAFHDQYRLKKIEELSTIDASYPRDLARGIVLYRLGRYLSAVEALRRHLDASPDGPFTLRAQNYLRAALGRAQDHDQALDP